MRFYETFSDGSPSADDREKASMAKTSGEQEIANEATEAIFARPQKCENKPIKLKDFGENREFAYASLWQAQCYSVRAIA